MGWLQSEARLYRAFLHAYPAEFRHEYGSELARVFEERLSSEPHAQLWLEAIPDLVLSALREHGHILLADVRHAVRLFAAVPAFTAIALLVLATGIGATITVFSVVNAVLLRSLRFNDPARLVYLWSPNAKFNGPNIPQELAPNFPDFYDWERLSDSFDGMTMLTQRRVNLTRNGAVFRVPAAYVTGSFFRVLGAAPLLGRAIDTHDDEPARRHVAVISKALWNSRFASDQNVIGKQLRVNRESYTVIGVMPESFTFPASGEIPYGMSGISKTELWMPLALPATQKADRVNFLSADAAIARLRPHVSAARAQAELQAIEKRSDSLYPPMWRGWTALVRPMVSTIVGPVEKLLWLLLGASLAVLAIALSNLTNLLLARMTARTHELGIRTALGAGRARLLRQLVTESLALSMAGGALGTGFACAAVQVLIRLNPGGIPRFETASIDLRVLLAALVLSLATGLVCGIVPSRAAARVDVNESLKQGGGKGAVNTRRRARDLLIVGEVALSVLLVAAAGLLIRSYVRLMGVNPGFKPASLTFQITLDQTYHRPEERTALYNAFVERVRALPGVTGAGAGTSLPLNNHDSLTFAEIKGRGLTGEMLENRTITPGFLEALGVPLLRGRRFEAQDLAAKLPPVIVNEAFAKRYMRAADPLGRQLRLGMPEQLSQLPWSQIVGVIGDIRHTTLEESATPQVFQIAWPGLDNSLDFAVSATDPDRTIAAVRSALHKLDPGLTLEDVHTMRERIFESNARRTFQTALLASFAAVAVTLALAGLYALLSYYVRQRVAEIGIRLALGATRAQILGMVVVKGMTLTGAGIASGIIAALAFAHLMRSWLFGVDANDPVTFGIVPVFLLAVSACACLIPAWHATRVDPVEALRQV